MKFRMKFLICVVFAVCFRSFVEGENLLSESMKKGVVKLGEACMKSVEASMEEMETLRSGPPYTGKGACVLACILDKAGIMSKKKYSRKGFMLAVTPFILTDPRKMNRMKEISTSCDKEITAANESECEIANHIVMCLREHIPQISDIKF